jgi:hypothetical protein
MTLHKIIEFYTEWFNICTNVTSKLSTITILKNFETNIILIQIKLVGTSMTNYCTKLHLLIAMVHKLPHVTVTVTATAWVHKAALVP